MNNNHKREKENDVLIFVCLFVPLIDCVYKKNFIEFICSYPFSFFFIDSDHVMMFNFLSYCSLMIERKEKENGELNFFTVGFFFLLFNDNYLLLMALFLLFTYFHPVFCFSSIIRTKKRIFFDIILCVLCAICSSHVLLSFAFLNRFFLFYCSHFLFFF